MGMGNNASRRLVGLFRDRKAPRPTATLRRARRTLMPRAEDLEGRTLLSVGLDPTYGFGGVAEVNQPATSATTSYSQTTGSIAMQNGQVVQVGTMTSQAGSSTSTTDLNVSRLTTSGTLDTSFGSSGTTDDPVDHRWRDIQCRHELHSTNRGPVERVDRRRGGRHPDELSPRGAPGRPAYLRRVPRQDVRHRGGRALQFRLETLAVVGQRGYPGAWPSGLTAGSSSPPR